MYFEYNFNDITYECEHELQLTLAGFVQRQLKEPCLIIKLCYKIFQAKVGYLYHEKQWESCFQCPNQFGSPADQLLNIISISDFNYLEALLICITDFNLESDLLMMT